jgi:hypothetical protein
MSRLEFIVRMVTVPRSIWPTPFAASRFSDGSKTELCGKKRETSVRLCASSRELREPPPELLPFR